MLLSRSRVIWYLVDAPAVRRVQISVRARYAHIIYIVEDSIHSLGKSQLFGFSMPFIAMCPVSVYETQLGGLVHCGLDSPEGHSVWPGTHRASQAPSKRVRLVFHGRGQARALCARSPTQCCAKRHARIGMRLGHRCISSALITHSVLFTLYSRSRHRLRRAGGRASAPPKAPCLRSH